VSEDDPLVFPCTIALGIVGATLGYSTARFVAKEEPRQCRTIAFETGIQNGPLSIGIANAAFLFEKTSMFVWEECEALCNEGVKYGCSGTGDPKDNSWSKRADYGYGSCKDDIGDTYEHYNTAAALTQELDEDNKCSIIPLLGNSADSADVNVARKMCVRLNCQMGYRADDPNMDYNPDGLSDSKYFDTYNTTATRMPIGLDNLKCPDYRATIVPLM
jgi:hypothetical protein